MSAINPVTSNAALTPLAPLVNLYTCPSIGKSHAVVDLSFFKPNSILATLDVFITTTAIGSITNLDALERVIPINTTNGTFLIEKAIVGQGESVYIRANTGSFNARLSGVEENNSSIAAAGKLSTALNIVNTPVFVFKPASITSALLGLGSLSAHNNSATVDSVIDIYITTGTTPAGSDYVSSQSLVAGGNAVFSNILLNANESLFVKITPNTISGVNTVFNGFVQR